MLTKDDVRLPQPQALLRGSLKGISFKCDFCGNNTATVVLDRNTVSCDSCRDPATRVMVKDSEKYANFSICDLRRSAEELENGTAARDSGLRDFLSDVSREVAHAREKFPDSAGLMTALCEELGEAARAIMEEPWLRVWEEAVQVAAVAARLAIEGDSTLDLVRKARVKE